MEDDDGMRRLVNELLPYFFRDIVASREEMETLNSSIRRDFFQNIKVVVFTRVMMVNRKWEMFLATNFNKMLSSHEMYLRYVMTASNFVAQFTDNIFDRILSVFALVITFSIETLKNTGVSFCELTSDIFMTFYNSVLKETFNKHGGMEKLEEYIKLHEYLTWNWHWRDIISSYDPNIFVAHIQQDLDNKIHNELAKDKCFPNSFSHDQVLSHSPSSLLVKKILFFSANKLPSMPSSDDLNIKLLAVIKEKSSKLDEEIKNIRKRLKTNLPAFSSNLNSGTHDNVE